MVVLQTNVILFAAGILLQDLETAVQVPVGAAGEIKLMQPSDSSFVDTSDSTNNSRVSDRGNEPEPQMEDEFHDAGWRKSAPAKLNPPTAGAVRRLPVEFVRPEFMPPWADLEMFWILQLELEERIARAAIGSNAAARVVQLVQERFCDLIEGAGLGDEVAAATRGARETIMGGAVGDILNPCVSSLAHAQAYYLRTHAGASKSNATADPSADKFAKLAETGTRQKITGLFLALKVAPVALTRCYFSLKFSQQSYCPGKMTESFSAHLLQKGDALLERAGCRIVTKEHNRNECMESLIKDKTTARFGKACCTNDIATAEMDWFPYPPSLQLPQYGYSSEVNDRCSYNINVPKCMGKRLLDNNKYFERINDSFGPRYQTRLGQPRVMVTAQYALFSKAAGLPTDGFDGYNPTDYQPPDYQPTQPPYTTDRIYQGGEFTRIYEDFHGRRYRKTKYGNKFFSPGRFLCLKKMKPNPCEQHYKTFFSSNKLVNASKVSRNANEMLSLWINRIRTRQRGRTILKTEMSWNVGTAMYTVFPGNFATKIGDLGFSLGTGYSGTTAWLFQLAEYLRLPLASRFAWRLAMIGYFVPYQHSLAEVLLGSWLGLQSAHCVPGSPPTACCSFINANLDAVMGKPPDKVDRLWKWKDGAEREVTREDTDAEWKRQAIQRALIARSLAISPELDSDCLAGLPDPELDMRKDLDDARLIINRIASGLVPSQLWDPVERWEEEVPGWGTFNPAA